MVSKVYVLAGAIFAAAISSCADYITESRDLSADLQESGRRVPPGVQAIFGQSCALAGCHADLQRPFLKAEVAYDNIVNVRSEELPDLDRIEPGDPSRSYLYMKITGASGIIGARMPKTGPPLTLAQTDTIRVWIESGAPPDSLMP